MRWFIFFILLGLVGCESEPALPTDDPMTWLPKVTNIRPDFPEDKAVLHVQAETTFLRLDADLAEAWALVSDQGLDQQQIALLAKNGIRAGTMDATAVSQFYTKVPRTGGTKVQTIGVGREPVIFETTPTVERAFEFEALLGFDRDETVRLPAGRTQLLLDVVIEGEKVMVGVTPHHHWMSPSIHPKSPHEKAMEGRMFKEISFDAILTGDRFLVLGVHVPEEMIHKAKPKEPAPPVLQPADGATAPAAPVDPAARPANPEPAVVPEVKAERKLKFGDLLFTGQRADRPLQLICIIRVPPQGEMLGEQLVRPER